MPRKPSTLAPAVRLRDNQRRARARRRALIDDLRCRVRDYETQGATATIEMQEAARRVASENKCLRALLAEKGVATVEVEAYLHDTARTVRLAALPTPPRAADPITLPVSMKSQEQPPGVAGHTYLNGPENDRVGKESGRRPPEEGREKYGGAELLSSMPDRASDYYHSDFEKPPRHAASQMQCDDAANILAGYRGHGDVTQARAELGCLGVTPCSITNAALFDTLDSENQERR